MKLILNKITSIILFLIIYCLISFSQNLESHKFIVIGDSQGISFLESLYWKFWGENNKEKTKFLFKEIANRNPDFIIHLGDIVSSGSSQSDWKIFQEHTKPIVNSKIKIYPIFGNHEYFGNDLEAYANFYQNFPFLTGKKWYSFISYNIGFIMLNSNFDDLSQLDTTTEHSWYLEQLSNFNKDKNIKYVIVCSHHPPFTNSKIVNPSMVIQKDYLPSFYNSQKSILFLNGHCHSYEKFYYYGKYFIVSGGGGGPRQEVNVDKLTRNYDDKFDGPEKRFFHFLQIEIIKERIIINVIKLNDDNSFSIVDQISIF